jgi:hypothetical protein
VIGCLLVALFASGCGRPADMQPSPTARQRDLAERFAAAVLDGDVIGARRLLVHPDEDALVFLVRRAAGPWVGQRVSIQLPARRTGRAWSIHYAGTRNHRDGTFERERGDLAVYVTASAKGAAVRYFMFRNVRTRYGTHHDAQLPPSKR